MTPDTRQQPRHVIIADPPGSAPRPDDVAYGLPYSKGLMASSIMATGLAPALAFHVAEVIEQRLHDDFTDSVSQAELSVLTLAVLRDEVGERYADLFAKWHTVKRLAQPVVILLGGATGVGKSTIATMLASRLSITRVIPTDAIREVMRALFSDQVLPTLQSSSFETSAVMKHPARGSDPVIAGFREQVSVVSVGIEALIKRAIAEGTHLIVEGAHIVPGFLDLDRYTGRAVVVPMMISVDDEELHRSHFVLRDAGGADRPSERYLEHFRDIRAIQQYLVTMAAEHEVPVVSSFSLDTTLSTAIDLVVTQAITRRARGQRGGRSPGGRGSDHRLPQAQERDVR